MDHVGDHLTADQDCIWLVGRRSNSVGAVYSLYTRSVCPHVAQYKCYISLPLPFTFKNQTASGILL